MKREWLFHGFFLVVFALVLYQFFVILEPFLTPILGAIVLAILSYPVHRKIAGWLPRMSASFKAACSSAVVIGLIVGPFLGLLWLLFNESQRAAPLVQDAARAFQNWHQNRSEAWFAQIQAVVDRLPVTVPVAWDDVQGMATEAATQVFSRISGMGKAVAKNLFLSVFNLAIVMVSLFFLFKDGERLLQTVKRLIPMRGKDKERILEKLKSTVTGIVRGSLLTCIFQMGCATAGYLVVGLPAAITWGMATGVAALIPFVGTALIWLPTGLYFLFLGPVWKGIFLLVWGVVVVGLMDNVVRTVFIGSQTRLPILLLFFGLLGGLRVYGIRGLLIGPLVVAVIPVLMDIFEAQYLQKEKDS